MTTRDNLVSRLLSRSRCLNGSPVGIPEEIRFLEMCRDAGDCGAVVPADLKVAFTLGGMMLVEEVAPNAFSITPAGRSALEQSKEWK